MTTELTQGSDLAIVTGWNDNPHYTLIRSRDPGADSKKLHSLKSHAFIKIRDSYKKAGNSMYLPDLVALHRNYLDHYLEVFLIPYTESHFRCFNEVEYPLDLTTVEGVWKDPLPNFANLIVLDLNLKSAIYWLIPIISAVRKAGPLRRIIIREIDDDTPWTFNWRELDLKLANLPFVYLIIVYPTHSVAKLLPTLLPLTDHSQRLCLEDSTDEDLNYYDPECDPVGRNSIFRKLSLPENEVVQVKPELKRKRE